MRKMQEKSKIYNMQDKAPTPPQIKPWGWQTPSLKLKRVATKTQDFSMAKDHTPSETKANQTKRQTQPNASTPRKEGKQEA
jgi:hypothetical protein